MPAVIPLVAAGIGAAGSAASASGGKKAQRHADSLAQQQLGLEQGMFNKAGGVLRPATDFWTSLMHGGQAAVNATGPIASQIGQAAQGARNSIAAMTPRGGEQNLAMANTYNDASNNIARLYAGMQPAAAQGLSGIGNMYMGAGQSLAFPASMSGMGAAQMGMSNAQGGAQGFGSMLFNSMNKLNGGEGGGGKQSGGGGGKQSSPGNVGGA